MPNADTDLGLWFQRHPELTRPDVGPRGVGANPLYNWAVSDTLAAWAGGVAAAVQKVHDRHHFLSFPLRSLASTNTAAIVA